MTNNPALAHIDAQSTKRQTEGTLSLKWADELRPDFLRPQLVEDLLEPGCMSVIFGQPKSAKTFFAFTMGVHIGQGEPFCGRSVERGLVVYVVGEGSYSIEMRLAAWRARHGGKSIPMAIITHALDMRSSPYDAQRLVKAIQEIESEHGEKVVLVILDTLARMNQGGDENSGQDMSSLIRHGDLIREATGAHITWVHHSGKDAARGMRGHSALLAAVDTAIEITDHEGLRTVEATAQRNMECGHFANFRLEKVEIGRRVAGEISENEGQPIYSCVMVATDEAVKNTVKNKIQGRVKSAVFAAVSAKQNITRSEIIEALKKQGKSSNSVNVALRSLVNDNVLFEAMGKFRIVSE